MSEDEADEEGPPVDLGSGDSIEGAPLARVASRLHWGMSKSEIDSREGETTIRTAEGPRTVGSILESVDVSYFESRREFVGAVRDAVDLSPVDTTEAPSSSTDEDAAGSREEQAADEGE